MWKKNISGVEGGGQIQMGEEEGGGGSVQSTMNHLPAVVFMFQFLISLPFFLGFHFLAVAEVVASIIRF